MLASDGNSIIPTSSSSVRKSRDLVTTPTTRRPQRKPIARRADHNKIAADASLERLAPIRAFMTALPSPLTLACGSPEFWNRLGVWHERIINESMSESAWMIQRLAQLDISLLIVLTEWLELTEDMTDAKMGRGNYLAQAILQTTGLGTTPPAWLQLFFLLDALVHGCSYRAIDEAAQLILPASTGERLSQLALSPRSQRLMTALQIFISNPADLELLMLYERAERYSYNRFQLAIDGQLDPIGHRHNASVPDKDILPLQETLLNDVLAKFEAGPRGGRASRCLRILLQAPDTQIVFLHRVLRQSSIAELERTIFGDEVETIVLKFHERMTVLEERSTKGDGVAIGQMIAESVRNQPLVAIREHPDVPRIQLRRFLDTLRHGEDPLLTFVELHLRSAPLNGTPVLVLRGSKEQPLALTLHDLEKHGLFFLEEFADIRHLGVTFESLISGRLYNHIFKIRIDRVQSTGSSTRFTLCYMAAQASTVVCKHFEEHMRTHHEITVVPATR